MGISFRRFDPDRDYRLLAEMHCSVNPDFLKTEEDLRRTQTYRPMDRPMNHWIGEENGVAVCGFGYGDQYWAHAEGRKIIEHYSYADRETDALDAILDHSYRSAAADGTNELNIWTRDDRPAQVEAFVRHGFRLVESQPVTRLYLDRFERNGLANSVPGLRFATIKELEEEGVSWMRPTYDSTLEIVADIPSHQETTPPSFETYCKWMENRETHNPANMFVALDGDQFVGYSSVQISRANPGLKETGLSGTVRSHRRRGIVTALKVFAIETLKQRGVKVIQTDNLDHNPMYGINQRLGFKHAWTWVHYLKEL